MLTLSVSFVHVFSLRGFQLRCDVTYVRGERNYETTERQSGFQAIRLDANIYLLTGARARLTSLSVTEVIGVLARKFVYLCVVVGSH